MNTTHRKPSLRFLATITRNRFATGLFALCAVAIGGAVYCLSPDSQGNERHPQAARLAPPPAEPLPTSAPAPVLSRDSAPETTPAPDTLVVERLTQQVAELSEAVARLEQTTRTFEDRLARVTRPLPTGDKTEAGLAGKKAEVDAQAKRSQAATAELQRFAARFGVALDPRVLTEPTFSTPLDREPGFQELRLAATNNLRILQAIERKFATDLLDRASFQ